MMPGMDRVDVADRWIAANTRTVWHALMDPEARERWLPPAGMHGHIESWDLTLGGGYRMVLTYDDAAATGGKSSPREDIVDAAFTRFSPLEWVQETIRFESDDPAYAEPMVLSWEIYPGAGETYVRVAATDVPDTISPADHQAGLDASLAQLARHVETPREH